MLLFNLALLASAIAAQLSSNLTQITNFGPNPRNVSMYIYVPSPLPKNAPIMVVPHWCTGTGPQVFASRPYASLGDQYGFISIYPSSADPGHCWDVSSNQSLTHEGGGDALGIVSMVRWTLRKYGADKNRVFVTGTSSGAMMTNVLVGSYPDVFAAGSAFAGVPFGCFAGNGYTVWNDDCAKGRIVKTGKEWAALVKAAYPGYKGFRPKMQILHGTNDTTLYPQNFREEIKQWTTVLGVSEIPTETKRDTPQVGWTRTRYGREVEAYEAANVTHNIPDQPDVLMAFFDLKCKGARCFSRVSGH
ncbi:carbohydrate esterase family 1 protein [Dothidotthia symphoricarpi CBS 119687]|uniref:Carboxylic ester hydrolase n=1 Tax=Dothidotthia symphoricarpi CBS 119687 TaxID=1392245 RepID=A0A6A6A331_9PLEO|nr:carbohydrate esterase family 1 protein [Dothidotthia symphoricarpi CBS 119687]KAF2125585.1 carbohydrate esterase family 1 protein [Dothidotthia symphoricarpi CBS 119687]